MILGQQIVAQIRTLSVTTILTRFPLFLNPAIMVAMAAIQHFAR